VQDEPKHNFLWNHFNPTRLSILVTWLLAWLASDISAHSFSSRFFTKSIGSTKLGQQYLKTKLLLQSSATLNLAMYMLLKAEQANAVGPAGNSDAALIQSHPVMLNLQKINSITQTLEDAVEQKVPGLKEQFENLVKAAALLSKSDDVSDNDSSSDGDKDEEDTKIESTKEPTTKRTGKVSPVDGAKSGSGSFDDSDDSDESSDDEAARNHKVLTEARFGLRQNEIAASSQSSTRRRKAPPMLSDAGDDDGDEVGGDRKVVSRSLATTLNSIEQRTASRKRRAAPLADGIDEPEEDDGELRRGLEMMEAELGKGSDEDDDEMGNGFGSELDDNEEDGNDFYSQVAKKSKSKKEFKKKLYQVAPKFPRVEGVVEGERAISKQILNNRGLVPHKPKINRNPRVKKREQYRKALIRRKGAVREVRTDEGHRYGGEETGIKTSLSRSRKLAR